MVDLENAIAQFGAKAKAKLLNPGVTGEPEDQLRAPLEALFTDVAELCGFKREWLAAVGESSLGRLKTRPDYAITLRHVLVGFVEVKAPGKGADPRRYKGHDREQWEKLQSLPNLLYTDGNSFSLWQNGELVDAIVQMQGNIETSGAKLAAPPGFLRLFDAFLRWEPIPPRTASDLAKVAARHQPDGPTRIFQAVQQPVCIVLAARSKQKAAGKPATVKYTVLPAGKRAEKFTALAKLKLGSKVWQDCPTDWRAPFLPAATGDWASYPALDELFAYNGSGVMPGRTWIIAPDAESLRERWRRLIRARPELKENLFHPHLRSGQPGDKHVNKVAKGLPGYTDNPMPVAAEEADCLPPVRYGYRSFDRQWIIPDSRVINQPNPELWRSHGARQVYLTAPSDRSPTAGPAISFTTLMPDLHHYNGRGGRVFPLWRDRAATTPNLPPKFVELLTSKYKVAVTVEDFLAYLAAVAANPAYTARFQKNLSQPGLRIPLTARANLYSQAVELGRRVIWLHTFGERFADPKANRAQGPPRLPKERAPRIPKNGAIPDDADTMPDEIGYDQARRRLTVGTGFIDNVPPAVWRYEVSGKRVLTQWFSYRKKNRERPIIGDRRQPSKLGDIQPDHWLAEYTTELLNVLHV